MSIVEMAEGNSNYNFVDCQGITGEIPPLVFKNPIGYLVLRLCNQPCV